MRPVFTLVVASTADGFIARHPAHSPAGWCSPEEQARFRAEVAAADWSIMGRNTHQAADRPDRRRIVFSTAAAAPEWRRPAQLWLNPAGLTPDDLAPLVEAVHPLRDGLILGGTAVHDWFLDAGRIDRVILTVEPVTFGEGLPVFSTRRGPPEEVFAALGFRTIAEEVLNAGGTRLLTLKPEG